MKIFLGSETEKKVYQQFFDIRKKVEENLQFLCKENVGLEEDDTYGTEFNDIGIITIAVPQYVKDLGVKERKLIKRKTKEADIRLYMDYERFIKETPKNQRLMYIENIIKSIEVLKDVLKETLKEIN